MATEQPPSSAAEDWFVRCPATDQGERCGYPSIDSAAWYMHGDEHESLNRCWGWREVRDAKEAKRNVR